MLFVSYGKEKDILSIGDYPIGSPSGSERGRTLEDVADRGCMLVEGQVFLWGGTDNREDLWDVDGGDATWNKDI